MIELKVYDKVWCSLVHSILTKYVSSEAADFIYDNKINGFFVNFDGVEEIILKQGKSEFVNIHPPIGPILLEDLDPSVADPVLPGYKTGTLDKRFKHEEFRESVSVIFSKMFHSSWDEGFYYRFIMLNEFLAQKGDSLTLGRFMKRKKKAVDKLFMNGESRAHSDTAALVQGYSPHSILNTSSPKGQKVLESMTKKEILKALEVSRSLFLAKEILEGTNVDSYAIEDDLEGLVAHIRAGNDAHEVIVLVKENFVKVIKASAVAFGFSESYVDDITENIYDIVSQCFAVMGHLTTERIINKLSEFAHEVHPNDILYFFVAFLDSDKILFDYVYEIKRYEVIDKALSNPKIRNDFVWFIAQMVTSYNGSLPLYDELLKSVTLGEDDYSLGPDLIIPMISAESNFRQPNDSESRFHYIEKIAANLFKNP